MALKTDVKDSGQSVIVSTRIKRDIYEQYKKVYGNISSRIRELVIEDHKRLMRNGTLSDVNSNCVQYPDAYIQALRMIKKQPTEY